MDVSLIADTLTIATQQTLGSANSFLLHRQNCINLADQSSQICVVVVDALAPPPVKSKTSRRTLLRKRRRTRRRSQTDGDSGGFGEEYGFFCGGDGLFGGGGAGMEEVLVVGGEGGILINSEGTIGMNLRGGFLRGLRVSLMGLFMRWYIGLRCRIACILRLRRLLGSWLMELVIPREGKRCLWDWLPCANSVTDIYESMNWRVL